MTQLCLVYGVPLVKVTISCAADKLLSVPIIASLTPRPSLSFPLLPLKGMGHVNFTLATQKSIVCREI